MVAVKPRRGEEFRMEVGSPADADQVCGEQVEGEVCGEQVEGGGCGEQVEGGGVR